MAGQQSVTTKQSSPQDYADFRRYRVQRSGIVPANNQHALVTSRIKRLMRKFKIENFVHRMKRLTLQCKAKLHDQIIDAMESTEQRLAP